jgi:DNA polymerase-3 subunit epsilon
MSQRVLFVDTETNGLAPRPWVSPAAHPDAWPIVVQVAWATLDVSCDGAAASTHVPALSGAALLTPPADAEWSADAEAVHGFSKAAALRDGVQPAAALAAFGAALRACDVVVAHNMEFDRGMLLAAAARCGLVRRSHAAGDAWWPVAWRRAPSRGRCASCWRRRR